MLEKVYVSPSPLLVGLAKEEKCGVKVSPRFHGSFAWVWQKQEKVPVSPSSDRTGHQTFAGSVDSMLDSVLEYERGCDFWES